MGVRLRAAAIVVHDGQVLLVSTKRGAPGYLVPPGGGVQAGETLQEAVVREVREEADLAIEAGRLLGYRELVHDGGMTLELYLAASLAGNLDLPSGVPPEDRCVRWIALGDLPGVPHFPEQLAELCRQALTAHTGALYLGRAECY
jgi:ADP-ribose pyrophosphatase YjhB (NUDIX family)